MKITWYGHAAFRLDGPNRDGDAVRIAHDPYRAPDVGTYGAIDDTVDVVAVSHQNEKYHSHIGAFTGQPDVVDGLRLLDAAQPEVVHGVPFEAIRVFEDDSKADPIAMIAATLGGVRILHMGDCGHALDAATVEACGSVDVLLALAGGPPTLELADLVDFVAALRPRVVIPMHFGNEKINLNLQPLTALLDLLPDTIAVRHFDSATVEIAPADLPETTEVWVLNPAR